MIVATAGHIDHGKTALVKALSGVDTDRLPEEKARGISIDIGFAYWKPEAAPLLEFVDVPGHERFVRNMLVGVCGIDYVMLVIAADDGVMPQTLEHLHIVDLLAVSKGMAVITKVDRVPKQRVDEVIGQVRTMLAGTALEDIDIVAASARSGEGMDRLRESLVRAAQAHGNRERAGRNFRYAIDRSFTIPGTGTVVTGTVFSANVSVGDKVILSPGGLMARIRAIQKNGSGAPNATAGERCALNLAGVDLEAVGRGDWLIAPAMHAPTQRTEARVTLLASESQSLKHWTPLHLHLGASEVCARVAIRRGASIAPGESVTVQLILDKPVAAFNGDRFVIRDDSARRTVGGGIIIDPFASPDRRNREARRAQLAALESFDAAVALPAMLACCPGGVDLDHFQRVFNLSQEYVEQLMRENDLFVIGKEPRFAFPRAAEASMRRTVMEVLAAFHRDQPKADGMEFPTLRRHCAPALDIETFIALLRLFAAGKVIDLAGSHACLPRHSASANPADEALWRRLKPLLDTAGFKSVRVAELAEAAKVKQAVVQDFLHRKAQTGDVCRVVPDRFYLRTTLAQLASLAESLAGNQPGQQFTTAQFRDASGVSRGHATEILECLDRLGITLRIGDVRKIRKDFTPILGPAPSQSSPPR